RLQAELDAARSAHGQITIELADAQAELKRAEGDVEQVVNRIDRDEASQYSSPFIWENSLRTELIVGGMVYRSHDPATGELLWELDMNRGRSSATPVAVGDVLYVGNEFRNRGGSDDGGGRLYAVTPGGAGDITPPGDAQTGQFITWRFDESGIQMASPVHCDGKLYFFQRRLGTVHCVDAETGDLLYRARVPGGKAFWASPWTDGKHVFALDDDGNTHVLESGERLSVIAVNELNQQAWGTPALADGRIYLRTVDHLYCLAAE
ncbi:MAG: PQQ-binding-like beta-propeller repeat protein, partial [Planctomycetota bacterium]